MKKYVENKKNLRLRSKSKPSLSKSGGVSEACPISATTSDTHLVVLEASAKYVLGSQDVSVTSSSDICTKESFFSAVSLVPDKLVFPKAKTYSLLAC